MLPVIWLGPDTPLLEAAAQRYNLFHVLHPAGVFRALQYGLAPALVIDLDLPELEPGPLLAALRQHWPEVQMLVVTTDQDQAITLSADRVVTRTEGMEAVLHAVAALLHDTSPRPTLNDYFTLQGRARRLETLIEASVTLSDAHTLEAILGDVRAMGCRTVDADDVAVLLVVGDFADLGDTLGLGVPPRYLEVCRQHLQRLEPLQRIAYVGDEVLLRERAPGMVPAAIRVREAEAGGAWSYMRLPLNIGERLVGFVAFFSLRPGQFDGARLQLARLFVAQVAVALRNIQRYWRLTSVETRQRAIMQVTQLITEDLALDDALARMAEQVVKLVGGDAGTIMLLQPDRSLKISALYQSDAALLGTIIPAGTGQAGMIALTGQPSVIVDYASWRHANPELVGNVPPGAAVIGVPLIYRHMVLGVLQVLFYQPCDPAALDDISDVLMSIAPHAAIAIAKAQLHEDVRREQRQLQAILTHTPQAVIVCDSQGCLQRANRQAQQLLEALHLSFAQIKDQRVADVIARLLPPDLELPAEGISQPLEVSLGSAGEYLLTVAPIQGDGDASNGYVAVAQDVTALRRLDRMRANLHRVLTHDLGNLIMLARTPLELLDEPDLTATQRDQLKTMLSGSLARMQDLINDVTTLEMADTLGQETIAPYDLASLARRAVRRNEDTARHAGITLNYTEQEKPSAPMNGHAVLVMQAIDNLISNAIKYTLPGGRVDVTLSVNAECAVITVKDSGIGIPPHKLEDIFRPFVRLKDPRTREVPGTGLGLSLVRTFVEAHGGHVMVQSTPDQGSTFAIYLPLNVPALVTPTAHVVPYLDLSALVDGSNSSA